MGKSPARRKLDMARADGDGDPTIFLIGFMAGAFATIPFHIAFIFFLGFCA